MQRENEKSKNVKIKIWKTIKFKKKLKNNKISTKKTHFFAFFCVFFDEFFVFFILKWN